MIEPGRAVDIGLANRGITIIIKSGRSADIEVQCSIGVNTGAAG
jgi:hypothetical protein